MGVKGIDISEHQSTMDVERVARDNNIEFGFVRTNYGANHDDLWFHSHADALERAGAIVVPYVYILASDVRGSIDDAVRIIDGRYDVCIVDWEHGSGGGAELRQAHELLWERGFSTPVVYDPKWYWESVGSPDVSWMKDKVKGHWKSWYADDNPKSYNAALAQVPPYVWQDNRGGIPTVIVQFTGTGRLASYGANVDLNYFPGSRQELEALLGTSEGDSMSWDTYISNHYGGDVKAGEMLAFVDEHVNDIRAEQAAQRALLAEIAQNPDVTAERLEEIVQKAVAAANAAHLAAQQRQLDATLEVVRDIVGSRDEELAAEVVTEIGRRTARPEAA